MSRRAIMVKMTVTCRVELPEEVREKELKPGERPYSTEGPEPVDEQDAKAMELAVSSFPYTVEHDLAGRGKARVTVETDQDVEETWVAD